VSLAFVFSFFDEVRILFNSRTDGFDILYSGNVFGHATLKNNFLVLNLGDCYNNNISFAFCLTF